MTQSQPFLNMFSAAKTKSSAACIALLGGGGKTALMFQLGREFAHADSRVLMTSITRAEPSPLFPVILTSSQDTINLNRLFSFRNPVYLLREQIGKEKYAGLSPAQLQPLIGETDVTLFECDGSRNRPLKAHNAIDPLVPDFATLVIIVVGADVVNTTLNDGLVHRPDLFQTLWNVDDDTVLDLELVTRVVTDQKGYLAKIPNEVEIIYFVNKADISSAASMLAQTISRVVPHPVFWGSLKESWWRAVP